MKRVTTLLTTLLILSVVALGTQAATFKLSGAYENLMEIDLGKPNPFNDLGDLFLKNSKFSLNLNIKEKEVSIDLGVKNWTIDNFNSSPLVVPVSPDTADSVYLSITSPRFEGFYLQGYNPNYYYESINDPMGIGNSIDSIMLAFQDVLTLDLYDYLTEINDLMWIGGNSLYFNYNYSLAGIYIGSPSHTNYFDNLVHAKFQIGNETGRFNFDGYYIDSEIKYLAPSDEKDSVASVGSYVPNGVLTDYQSMSMSGPVIRATGEFSDYFVLGTTLTMMRLEREASSKFDSLFTTIGLDITGKIRFIGGEYFVSGMKTLAVDIDYLSTANPPDPDYVYTNSDGLVFYAGFKNVPLGKYKQFRIGANYLFIPTDIHLLWGDSILDEAVIVANDANDDGFYRGDPIRKVGASLGITLGKVDIDLTNNTYFVEGEDGVKANTTTLDVVLSNSSIARWNFKAYNVLKPMSTDALNNLTIAFDAAFKLGKYVTLGASTFNTFEMVDIYNAIDSTSNGTSSLWGHVDFVATSGIIADSKLTLGGMVGYNYGDVIEEFILDLENEIDPTDNVADVLGKFIYDSYVGVNLNITNKARINGGLYVGRRLYEAYQNVDYAINKDEDAFFFSWKEPLIVGTLNAQYDISQVVTISVTGTYRGKEYMKVEDTNSSTTVGYFYEQSDPQYYAEAAVIVKPNDTSTIKVGWGFDGLSDAKLDGKANVRPWTYLKLPITDAQKTNWAKKITLDISIKF